nr:putative ribonuclease h protein [Quercus suber]
MVATDWAKEGRETVEGRKTNCFRDVTFKMVWNSATLQQLFNPRDAELIHSIPLSTRPVEDVLIWPFTPTGSYTVKSGYRFLYKSQSLDNNDYQPVDNTLWKKIWGSQVQPKVRSFLWRALKNSIPTKLNLRRRTILADDWCDQCKGATEDVIHVLWSCPLLSQVWSHDSTWNYNATPYFASFRDLVEHIIDMGNDLNLFATTVWEI